jgi:hypothetical protein
MTSSLTNTPTIPELSENDKRLNVLKRHMDIYTQLIGVKDSLSLNQHSKVESGIDFILDELVELRKK